MNVYDVYRYMYISCGNCILSWHIDRILRCIIKSTAQILLMHNLLSKTSTMGTINMLGLAKRVKARILMASTSEIYGDPTVHPQPESYWGNVNTIGPRVSI